MSLLLRISGSWPFRFIGRWLLNKPLLAAPLKRMLRLSPTLFARLRQAILHRPASPCSDIVIPFESFDLVFAAGPLEDKRGIGRVAHELLESFRRASERALKSNPRAFATKQVRPKVWFFSAIQWCPPRLPDRSLVVIHDVTPLVLPRCFPLANQRDWIDRCGPIARQAAVVVSISQSSAADIERHLGLELGSVRVVLNGVTSLPRPMSSSVQLPCPMPSGPYVVFLGSNDYHKNLDVVLQALENPRLIELSLVWVGDAKNLKFRPIPSRLKDRVYLTGHLPDHQVAQILLGSLALVFPSRYEGFGLPPFEAALLGVPSICSRKLAMTDLLADVAWFADEDDPNDWVEHLLGLQKDPQSRIAMGRRAQAYARSFTWERSVSQLLPMLQDLSRHSDKE